MADDEEEPLAAWEALLLPDWRWEAFEKEDDGRYYGRVKSPMTYGRWEWGTFTRDQLETAGAYRVDTDDEDAELFPDGGYVSDAPEAKLYETELAGYEERDRGDDPSTE